MVICPSIHFKYRSEKKRKSTCVSEAQFCIFSLLNAANTQTGGKIIKLNKLYSGFEWDSKTNRKMYQVDGIDLNEDAHFC